MSNAIATKNLEVIVIGAGTGGLCLAHGLKRAGITVNVFERDRTRKDGLQGYRVGIDPDGSRALHANLPKELFETFIATCAISPKFFNIFTEHLSEVLSVDATPADPDSPFGEHSVSRMTLRQVLLTGLEPIVHFDKVFSHYEHLPDGRVIAHFEDGTSAVGDVLVAADGSNSRARRQYLPQAQMEDTLIRSIGGKVPATRESLALVTPKIRRGVSLIQAPGGLGGILHVMEFPWDKDGVKHGIGSTDADLIAQWPGLMFDNTRDYISWGIWASADKFPSGFRDMTGPELLAQTQKMTANWHPDWKKLLTLSDPGSVFPVVIRTSVPLGAWTPSNVTLLGDAIHTMTPGRGVGANTALRDAVALTRHLIAVRDGRRQLSEAIGAYEQKMRTYGYEAVLKSRQQMDGRAAIHKPFIGRMQLGLMRAVMRTINATPPLKRKMTENLNAFRDHAHDDVELV